MESSNCLSLSIACIHVKQSHEAVQLMVIWLNNNDRWEIMAYYSENILILLNDGHVFPLVSVDDGKEPLSQVVIRRK